MFPENEPRPRDSPPPHANSTHTAPPTVLETPHGSSGRQTTTGWPGSVKPSTPVRRAMLVLSVALLLIAVAATAVAVKSRFDASEAKDTLADVRGALADVDLDGGTEPADISNRIEELLDQQDDDDDTISELEATIEEQAAHLDDADAERADAETLNSALATQLSDAQADLETAQKALATAQATTTPYVIEPDMVIPTYTDFSVETNKISCDGFADIDKACPPTLRLNGRFILDSGQLYMEFAELAKVPVTSVGFGYVGQTSVTDAYAFTCDRVNTTTQMSVQATPTEFVVDPMTNTITVSAFTFTWTIVAPQTSNCVTSGHTYSGTLTF